MYSRLIESNDWTIAMMSIISISIIHEVLVTGAHRSDRTAVSAEN